MRLFMEPWGPRHGTSAPDPAGPGSGARPDLSLELAEWAAVQPAGSLEPRRVVVVDGILRPEARVHARLANGVVAPGLLGAVAAGALELGPHSRLVAARLRRLLVLAAPILGEPLEVPASASSTGRLVYEPEPAGSGHARDGALEARLLLAMREAEAALAAEVAQPGALLLLDGPLPDLPVPGAVGLVKAPHNLLLPAPERALLARLLAGQRTPVFLVTGRPARLCWFVKLSPPVAHHHALTGVVRLEVAADEGLEFAISAADWSAVALPKLASPGWRDPRAPAQLVPIAHLERELRRRLGALHLVRRRLAARLHSLAREGRTREEGEAGEGAPS